MKKQIGKTESDSNNQEIAAACVPELLRQQFESNQQYDYDINEAYRMENNPLDDDNLYRFMNYSMEDNSFLTIGKSQERAKSKDNTNVPVHSPTTHTHTHLQAPRILLACSSPSKWLSSSSPAVLVFFFFFFSFSFVFWPG